MGRRIVCVFTLVTIIIMVYSLLAIYYLHVITWKSTTPLHRRDSHPNVLLILVSQPRSGSTFLSRIISKSLESIYFYEPLYMLDKKVGIDTNFVDDDMRQKYDKQTTSFLRNIFRCDFTNRKEWIHLYKSPFKVLSTYSRDDKECDENLLRAKFGHKNKEYQRHIIKHCMPFLNSNHLQRQCQKMNLMVKLLEPRIPNHNLQHLQSLIHPEVLYKIVYLMRDPRASFYSLLRTGWIAKFDTDILFRKYISLRCENMYRSIQEIKKTDNFIFIRYEDFVTLPEEALHELETFLKPEVMKRIHKQLRNIPCYIPVVKAESFSTNYSASIHYPTTRKKTTRTSKPKPSVTGNYSKSDYEHRRKYECFTVNKWRYKSDEDLIRYVETSCSPLMKMFGYKILGTEMTNLRNMSYPVILPFSSQTWN